jgi:geranylgeranyl reductase family protein
MYDVIVVGAGPAGSTAAKYAAEGGAKTLIIEKRRKIGVPVQCGEFLQSINEIADIAPKAENLEELFNINKNLISRKTDKVRIISPKGKKFEFDFSGMVLERKLFDNYLAGEAVKAGAELMTETKVLGVEKNNDAAKVITNSGTYEGKIIVGADGPVSTVARCMNMQKPEIYPCVNYELAGNFEPVVEMYMGGVAPGGYAWVIPKKETANVGLGVQKKFAGKLNLKKLLDKFVEKLNLEKPIVNYSGGNVPCYNPAEKTVKGNVMLVGDAAGQVMASNGGGIPIAMICGRIAGQVCSEYIKNKSKISLSEYEKRWRMQVGETLAVSLKTKKLADMAFGSETLLEIAINKLGSRGMERVVRCKPINPLSYI